LAGLNSPRRHALTWVFPRPGDPLLLKTGQLSPTAAFFDIIPLMSVPRKKSWLIFLPLLTIILSYVSYQFNPKVHLNARMLVPGLVEEFPFPLFQCRKVVLRHWGKVERGK